MKRISITLTLISVIIALTGCESLFESRHEVVDNSFEIKTDIAWNAEHMTYSVSLSLAKGVKGEYDFVYNIDSVNTLMLMDTNRTEVKSGTILNLNGKEAVTFMLPYLSDDSKHSLNMEFTKESITRSYSIALPEGGKSIFTVKVNPSVDLERTLLSVTGSEESSKASYLMSFQIDGKQSTSVKYQGAPVEKGVNVDFAKSNTYIFEMPALDPGQHSVTVTALSQFSSHSVSEHFSEPNRFIYEAYVEWNAEYMANMLKINLLQGIEGSYRLDYRIDGGTLPEEVASKVNYLTYLSGSMLANGSNIDLRKNTPSVFLLPAHACGSDYSISLTLSNDELTKTEKVDLSNLSDKILSIDVDASDKYTYSLVKLTNLRGDEASSYKVSFKLDGTPLEGVKYNNTAVKGSIDINFQSKWEHTFELPYLAYGSHTLAVTIASSKTSKEFTATFKEPKRKSTTLNLAYNSYTGQLTVASDYNPYSTNFSISASVTVKGSITYRHTQAIGIADPQTVYFTETAESTIKLVPGITAAAIDGGVLKKTLDKVFNNTRTDAANWLGNGNARTLNADITSVELRFTIHSLGANEGCTPVKITPTVKTSFPVKYTYKGTTWNHNSGYVNTLYPTYTINGKSASSISEL